MGLAGREGVRGRSRWICPAPLTLPQRIQAVSITETSPVSGFHSSPGLQGATFFLHGLLPTHVRLGPPLLGSRFELRLLPGSPQHRPQPARHLCHLSHSQDPALSAYLSVLPLRNSILPRSPDGPRQPQGVLHTPAPPTLSHLPCLPPIGRGGRVTFRSPPLGFPTPSPVSQRRWFRALQPLPFHHPVAQAWTRTGRVETGKQGF